MGIGIIYHFVRFAEKTTNPNFHQNRKFIVIKFMEWLICMAKSAVNMTQLFSVKKKHSITNQQKCKLMYNGIGTIFTYHGQKAS